MITDHRGFILNLDTKEFFNWNPSKYNIIDTRLLNSWNRVYRRKFKNKLEKLLNKSKLCEKVQNMCIGRLIVEEANIIDNEITWVLNTVRKHIEGIKRNILSSLEKHLI